MGGAGVGDGEREVVSVAPGIVDYECWSMRDGANSVVVEDLLGMDVVRTVALFTSKRANSCTC